MIPRILWHMGAGVLRRKLSPQPPGGLLRYPSIWKTRASLTDCNWTRTLPEKAYYRSMELAIWYGCGAQGILHACARNRWHFVFGSQGVRHLKPIRLFQRYEVHTRNVYWDDAWLFLLAQFKCPDSGEVFAEGLSRCMLRSGRDRVDSRLLYEEMGVDGLPQQLEMPDVIHKFLQWDAATESDMKATAEANAMAYDSSQKPGLLSTHSMNLPFQDHVHGHGYHVKGDSIAMAYDSGQKPGLLSTHSMNLPFQGHVHGHGYHVKGTRCEAAGTAR